MSKQEKSGGEPAVITEQALDWVERQAVESMKGRYATAEMIAKEGATTLTLLMTGMGASLAYVVKQIEAGAWTWLTLAVALLAPYLLVLGMVLIRRCLMLESMPAIHNTPKNLEYGEMELALLRRAELRGLQIRIDKAFELNERRAKNLNWVRQGLALSPVFFIAVAALSAAYL